jgi:hypothetical protein
MPTPLPRNIRKVLQLEDQVEEEQLDFFTALRLVKSGERITSLSWGNRNIFLSLVMDLELKVDVLYLTKQDESIHRLIVSLEDMERSDWVVLSS